MYRLITGLTLAITIAGSAVALEERQTRPSGLKAQVDLMKQEIPDRFLCMVLRIKVDYGDDHRTALYVLKNNVKAYWDLREGDYPDDIIAKAFDDHTCNFSTALYVIKRDTKAANELNSLLDQIQDVAQRSGSFGDLRLYIVGQNLSGSLGSDGCF